MEKPVFPVLPINPYSVMDRQGGGGWESPIWGKYTSLADSQTNEFWGIYFALNLPHIANYAPD